jgi:hypothetical protein
MCSLFSKSDAGIMAMLLVPTFDSLGTELVPSSTSATVLVGIVECSDDAGCVS